MSLAGVRWRWADEERKVTLSHRLLVRLHIYTTAEFTIVPLMKQRPSRSINNNEVADINHQAIPR